MRSVAFVEEDFVAGLLKDYFAANGAAARIASSAGERNGSGSGVEVWGKPEPVTRVTEQLSRNQIDLLLLQCEDLDKLVEILEMVRKDGRPIPTLVLTSKADQIPDQYETFVHCISLKELLESNLRWHVRLARTKRIVERVHRDLDGADSILILLQDDPDPDAIASGLALRQVLGRNKQTAPLGSFGRVTRPENISMIKLLDIEIERITRTRLKTFERVAMVDLQPPHLVHPPARVDLVIDHHPEQLNYKSGLNDIRPNYGATATILFEYLHCEQASIGTRLATALLYGIKSDTFLLAREVSEWDVEAFSHLYPLANHNWMRRIERPQLPPAALDALSRALKTRRVIDKVAFVHLGNVEREDLIPQMADFCLQFEGIDWSVVSGVFDANFIMSVRNVGYVRAAGKILKEAFGEIGSAGGHASMAKAVIPLSELSRRWNLDVRNTRSLNARVQKAFLQSLRRDER